jgi:hypothetical protein
MEGIRKGAIKRVDELFKRMEKKMKEHYLMQFFTYEHLPEHLQGTSKNFCELAQIIDQDLPENSEKTTALRKLLEAKDCAVRAVLFKENIVIPKEEKTDNKKEWFHQFGNVICVDCGETVDLSTDAYWDRFHTKWLCPYCDKCHDG